MKNTFIFRNDWIDGLEMLEKEEIVQVLRACAAVQKKEDVARLHADLVGPARICFGFMRQKLELDASNYTQVCERNRKNGILGGRKKPTGPQSPPAAPSGGQRPPVAPSRPDSPPVGASGGQRPPHSHSSGKKEEEKKSSSSLIYNNYINNAKPMPEDDDDDFSSFCKEDQELIRKWEAEFSAPAPLSEPDLINKIRRMLAAKAAGRLAIKIPPAAYLRKCVNDFGELKQDNGSERAEKEYQSTLKYLESQKKASQGVRSPGPKSRELLGKSDHPCTQGADSATAGIMPDTPEECQAKINVQKCQALRARLAAGMTAQPGPAGPDRPGLPH